MARRSSHPFDLLVDRFAQLFADRISSSLPRGTLRDGAAARGASKLAGSKLDMRCRYPGCKNRSKGPRFRFLCEEHLKLPKKEQGAALAKWAEKNAEFGCALVIPNTSGCSGGEDDERCCLNAAC